MRQTRTESGRGLRVSRPRAMVKTSFIFEENGASSMTQSVTVPDPHGSEKTARENAEHGFIASDALSKNLQTRSEEHTSELQSRGHLVCRLLLEKKKNRNQ